MFFHPLTWWAWVGTPKRTIFEEKKSGAYISDSVWDQITNDPTKFGEFLIDYGRTKDELKQVKAKNDILMHTEKTYTVTEIAKELGVSSAKVLNQILSRDGIQYYINDTWVLYTLYTDRIFYHSMKLIWKI